MLEQEHRFALLARSSNSAHALGYSDDSLGMLTACEWLLRQVGVTNSGEDYCSTPFGLRLANCDWHREDTLFWLRNDVNLVIFEKSDETDQYQGYGRDVYRLFSWLCSSRLQGRKLCSARRPWHDLIVLSELGPYFETCTSVDLPEVSILSNTRLELDLLVILKAARSSRSLPSTPLPPKTYMTSSTKVAECPSRGTGI